MGSGKKSKRPKVSEHNFYHNWTLLVDADFDIAAGGDDQSDCGASTIAGLTETDCENFGMTLRLKDETMEMMSNRWCNVVLNVEHVMLDVSVKQKSIWLQSLASSSNSAFGIQQMLSVAILLLVL